MAYVRATVQVNDYTATFLGDGTNFLAQAEAFAREVRAQLPIADSGDVSLQELAIFQDLATADSDTIAPLTECAAGDTDGDLIPLTVLTALNFDSAELVSVWEVENIATDAGPPIATDRTAEATLAADDPDTPTVWGVILDTTDTTGNVVIASVVIRTIAP